MTTNDSVMIALFELFNSITYVGFYDVIPEVFDGSFYGPEKTNPLLGYAITSLKEEKSANSFGVLRIRRKFTLQSVHSIARNDFILKPKYAQTLKEYSWTRSENTYSCNDGYDLPFIHHREKLVEDQRQMVLQTFNFIVTSSYNDVFEIQLDTVFQFTEFSNDPLLFTLKGLHQISNLYEKYTHHISRSSIIQRMNSENIALCVREGNEPFADMISSALSYWVEINPDLARQNVEYMECPYIHYYDPPVSYSFEQLNPERFELCSQCNEAEIKYYGFCRKYSSFRQRVNDSYREHKRLEIERTFCPDTEIPLISQGGSWKKKKRLSSF